MNRSISLPLPGPVSSALEAELRERVARHGLVIWLDVDNHYCDFVEAIARFGCAKSQLQDQHGN